MTIRRVVPNLLCRDVAATTAFYRDVLGFAVAMDMGWIVTLASPANDTAQVSLSTGDPGPRLDHPQLTVEVADVDAVRATAGAAEVLFEPRDEEWGVRRFFVRDPDGRVVNVMAHPA